MYDLTVLIEIFNYDPEIENIVSAIESELKNKNLTGEIIINFNTLSHKSCDKPDNLKTNSKNLTILYHQDSKEYENLLAYGVRSAKSDNLIFYNVRYSLSPAVIPALFHELQSGKDLVIGKRNFKNIKDNLQTKNRNYGILIENNFARLLFPNLSDPTSDIFAIKKDVISSRPLNNPKNNNLLEILGKGNWKEEKEISLDPYLLPEYLFVSHRFSLVQYVLQLLSISFFSIQHRDRAGWKEIRNIIKFGIVGITGIFVNTGILYILSEIFNIFYLISSVIAIELSIINNFVWNDVWTFGNEKNQKISRVTRRFLSYQIVSIGGILINVCVLFFLTEVLGVYYLISNLIGILIAFSWNFLVNRMTTWRINTVR
jgi:dolichol-phosphate mannosyltransferase